MIGLSIWDIIGFIDFIFLIIFFFIGKNQVWAAFTMGFIIAIITAVIFFIKDGSWPWELFKRIIIAITSFGVLLELIARMGKAVKRTKS